MERSGENQHIAPMELKRILLLFLLIENSYGVFKNYDFFFEFPRRGFILLEKKACVELKLRRSDRRC